MAVSLEVRVPIIDHRVVALAWRLPSRMRLHDGQSKWILRRILSRFVPETMTERHKMGFGIPVGAWLRGPLRDWAESHLSEAALTRDNLLDPGPIRQRWDAHVRGRENWEYPLWTILMLQAWRAKYG
jgi:asparagine synthase (glutamine-hydrolysing)